MPSIPMPTRSAATPDAVSGVPLDAGALSAEARGYQQLGAGIADVGAFLTQHNLEVQQHIGEGYLAQEEIERRKAAAEMEAYMAANQGKPETWETAAKDIQQRYKDGRDARMKEQQWSPTVRRVDDLKTAEFQTQAGIVLNAKRQQAQIAVANDSKFQNATDAMDAGDEKAAMGWLDSMNLSPEKRRSLGEKLVQDGWTQRARSDLDADPAKFIDDITAKNEDGSYKNYGSLKASQREQSKMFGERELARQRRDLTAQVQSEVSQANASGIALDDTVKEDYYAEADKLRLSRKVLDTAFKPARYVELTTDIFKQLRGEIAAVGKDDDAKYLALSKDISVFPPGQARSTLTSALESNFTGKADATAEKPAVAFAHSSIADHFRVIEQDAQAVAKDAGSKLTAKEVDALNARHGDALMQADAWFEQNPKATRNDFSAWWDDYTSREVRAKNAAVVGPGIKRPGIVAPASAPAERAANLDSILDRYKKPARPSSDNTGPS